MVLQILLLKKVPFFFVCIRERVFNLDKYFIVIAKVEYCFIVQVLMVFFCFHICFNLVVCKDIISI